MRHPQISIVIPVYNRQHIVLRTLDSVKAQTYRPIRLILVDNNSTDDSLSTLLQWCSTNCTDDFEVTVACEATPGAPAARNAGLKMVDTTWTMFFDSDDVMSPDHIARAMSYVDEHPDVDVVGWDVEVRYANGSVARKTFSYPPSVYSCIMDGAFSTLRYMARTSAFNAVSGWDIRMEIWDDIELGARLLSIPGLKVGRIAGKPTVSIYPLDESISGASYYSRASKCEHALDIIHATISPSRNYIVQLKRAILAAHYYIEGYKTDARRLFTEAMDGTIMPWNRLLISFAYHYTRFRGRGAAKLLKKFFRNEPL